MHERIDYGLAVAASAASGGGKVVFPPWYETEDTYESDDSLIASLSRLGTKKPYEER